MLIQFKSDLTKKILFQNWFEKHFWRPCLLSEGTRIQNFVPRGEGLHIICNYAYVHASRFVSNTFENFIFPRFPLYSCIFIVNQHAPTRIVNLHSDFDTFCAKGAEQLRRAELWRYRTREKENEKKKKMQKTANIGQVAPNGRALREQTSCIGHIRSRFVRFTPLLLRNWQRKKWHFRVWYRMVAAAILQ